MAITSCDISCDKFPMKSSCSTHSSKGDNSCRLLKINFAADGSFSSVASKRGKSKKMHSKSPYLNSDRVQLLSRVTEKRLVHKKTTDFVSSFPLAVNIYKANSDEFKSSKKVNKKVKKSVLTLPNDPAPVPQVCTVSDMNDSEYSAKNDEDRKLKVIKKRTPIQNNRKARVREKDFEFYDRDAQYCSQLNINLDCSSTDIMKNFNGDGKRVSIKKKNSPHKPQTGNNNLSDVWTVLRNMNRLQFKPSPPISEESIPIKKKVQNRRGKRVIETCRTEEFAYISSFELDRKVPCRNFSRSSSTDRVTVIDKQDEFSKICEEFEKRLLKTHDFLKDSNYSKNRNQRNKNQYKISKNVGPKDNKSITLKKKKRTSVKVPADPCLSLATNGSDKIDSLIDVDSPDHFDNSSHKTANDSMHAMRGSFTYSDYSGSSKGDLSDKLNEEHLTIVKYTNRDSSPLKRIPKVVLSPEQSRTEQSLVEPNRFDSLKRKPRLVTTMPSSSLMPKLTQTEIKKRLAQIRFPLVILGKDQVSSSIQVPDYDYPQFDGLDDHIWPFMMQWSEETAKDPKLNNYITNRKCNSYLSESNANKTRKNAEVGVCKQTLLKDKKQAIHDSITNKKKLEIKRLTPCPEMNPKVLQSSKKQKSIVQFKDKMLNFLYKKSSSRHAIHENQQNFENDANKNVIVNKVDATTDTQVEPVMMLNDLRKRRIFQSPVKKAQGFVYPWAKAKWASDFIENVIKKIRNGVYYSQDHVIHKYRIELKEVSVQAGSLCDSSNTQTSESDTCLGREVAITRSQKSYTSIPGFNNTQPVLEIKTLNMKQIAIKHCITNVMVQFDVTIPTKNDQSTISINKSLSFIPIEVTESHTKIYKCKTTIGNAILPAELCSILPRMMSSIVNSNVITDRPALCPSKTDSCLSTITEITRYEMTDCLSILSSVQMSTELKTMLEGSFSNKMSDIIKPTPKRTNPKMDYNKYIETELLPTVSLTYLLRYEVNPLLTELNNSKFIHTQLCLLESNKKMPLISNISNSNCSAIDLYNGSNNKKSLNTVFTYTSLVSIIQSMFCYHDTQINRNLFSYFDMLKLQYDGRNIKISMSMTNNEGVQNKVLVTISNLKIDSLYKAFPKKNTYNKNRMNTTSAPLKCIEYNNTSQASKSEHIEVNQVTGNRIKRKGFYKLYRKCKSTTNLPSAEKCANTPLNKVTTLDDFFQILGSKKMLSSVFDGYAKKKILSSLMEVRNWITEINPKQALLILLLTNKKDTPNLIRFRPILLQGIAVNRITRASELDMEIEVIERENLNKFSQLTNSQGYHKLTQFCFVLRQYEGISYLPESVTNYDNLLEELYWIAKTTASDYQRPFDESSERLLKALLEKRKKLNPSYLRVMARYVGLGLLKPPTKN